MIQPLKKLKQPLFYRIVQDTIKNYILENNLKAGDPLPAETELARQLGISRNSLREAAKALESVGILETRQGSGLFVKEFSFQPLLDNMSYGLLFDLRQLDELLQVRKILECSLIGDVIQKISEEQLNKLSEIKDKMRVKAELGEGFPEEDRQFHRVLFENQDNQVLLKLLDVFWLAFHKATNRADLRNNNPMSTYQDHMAIIEAIENRNVELARTTLEQHYASIEGRLEQVQKASI
jgi:DNA-binding FadR family transcriptional regulator